MVRDHHALTEVDLPQRVLHSSDASGEQVKDEPNKHEKLSLMSLTPSASSN